MRRFRLGTLLLVVVIVAMSFALVVQQMRMNRRVAELEAIVAEREKIMMNLNKVINVNERYAKTLAARLEAVKKTER